MIDIKAKIHDKFSVEFKVGFFADGQLREKDFSINTWIFIPNSLDINPGTYGKKEFYRDVKSNVRLITPVFNLSEIAGVNSVPLRHLRSALEKLSAEYTTQNVADYEYHIKMFSAIVKSSLREAANCVISCENAETRKLLCRNFASDTARIMESYRSMRRIIESDTVPDTVRNYYSFGDEFCSRIIESYSYRILRRMNSFDIGSENSEARRYVVDLIRQEADYKREAGYTVISRDDPQSNRNIVFRYSILKKYVESELYIRLVKKRDGRTIRQVYYSIAAGIAMIFATIIAFAFQRRFGNFSMPLFVALVVSYMLKDRIKDLMRYYFAHKLGKKYFDNKAEINIKNESVGWLKEGVDFITDDQVPEEVLNMRGRSPLLEAENRIFDEKIILYRKLVRIDAKKLQSNDDYSSSGINDILRLHINRLTLKMDDPQVPLRRLRHDGSIEVIYTEKIYYINIIMQFKVEESYQYKRFRLITTRDGIREIQELN